jgi:hypothetical protein
LTQLLQINNFNLRFGFRDYLDAKISTQSTAFSGSLLFLLTLRTQTQRHENLQTNPQILSGSPAKTSVRIWDATATKMQLRPTLTNSRTLLSDTKTLLLPLAFALPADQQLLQESTSPHLAHTICDATLNFPKVLSLFPIYLRKAGYYCTNNSKQDYQFKTPSGCLGRIEQKSTLEESSRSRATIFRSL